jgi:hypothetical protein
VLGWPAVDELRALKPGFVDDNPKKGRRGNLIGNVAMAVLLIAPWALGELYQEPAATQAASENLSSPPAP